MPAFFKDDPNLATVPLAPQPGEMLPDVGLSPVQASVANTWNQFGGLLQACAALAKVEVSTAVATLAVESGGRAFAAGGSMIIRFENHIFWDLWGQQRPARFHDHFRFGSPSWQGHLFRANSAESWIPFHGNQQLEWRVFRHARAIDETSAMRSISMGAPQIMGFHASTIGYDQVQNMFSSFQDPRFQVIGFFDFVGRRDQQSQLLQIMRDNRFREFARRYNGGGQVDRYERLIRDARTAFLTLLDHPESSSPSGEYVVASGDTLGMIADRFSVDLRALAKLNNIRDINQIFVGQRLTLPSNAREGAPTDAAVPLATPLRAGEYIAEEGDTLTSIAETLGWSVALLAKINDLMGPDAQITPGDVLRIPTRLGTAAPPASEQLPLRTYTVRAGDTLGLLSRRFNTSVAELVELNGIDDPSLIRVGQVLRVGSA